jgi:hypothetical protein
MLEEEKTVFISAGCNDCLRKPFREEDVFAAMQKHIGVRYIYEDKPQANKLAIEDWGGSKISPSDFRALPTASIAHLTAAISNFDLDLIANLIEKIPDDDATLALAIKRCINDLDYQIQPMDGKQ